MYVLNPKEGEIKIPVLGFNSKYNDKKIQSIQMVGSKTKIKYSQNAGALTLSVPWKRPTQYATLFKIEGLLK